MFLLPTFELYLRIKVPLFKCWKPAWDGLGERKEPAPEPVVWERVDPDGVEAGYTCG